MKKQLYELKPGGRFTYGGIEWVSLEVDREVIALAVEPVFSRAFDDGNANNWHEASLRWELNGPFVDALVQEGAAKGEFLPFESDLTADDGATDYGETTDVIALLTCDLYREFRALIPRTNQWCWTVTPWTCLDHYSDRVRTINDYGVLHYDHAKNACGGVRPLVHLKADTPVIVADEARGTATERAAMIAEAEEAVICTLGDYPAKIWGDVLGGVVASLIDMKQEAAEIAQINKKAVEG